ncbi:hypothetical protein [Amycolatopsis sp. NPDC000740]|uniref:hypothetical protein n=1 Tax=Amycolatopsis sp. NPDC000740 TaxID=3154269 RepID=UPI00331DA46C
MWLDNRDVWPDGMWLRAALSRLLGVDDDAPDALLPRMWRQHGEGALFSLYSCRLAEGLS